MKPLVKEQRFDFRGGRNTAISSDLLNENELVDATNARLSQTYGGISKRSGSRRLHPGFFGDAGVGLGNPLPVIAVGQWDSPVVGNQIVAMDSFGNLYFKPNDTTTNFTGTGMVGVPPHPSAFFVPFRAATSGAPLTLFIAETATNLAALYKWTGAVLTQIDGINSAPPAGLLAAYHTRLFAVDQFNFKKTLFWSRVGDGEQWGTGTKTDGGSAIVGVLNGEAIVALEVIGSSLLIATNDCLMRFTGQSSDDIVIAQDTEGVSSEIGAAGPYALTRFENVAALLNRRGAYAATETACEPIGEQINPDWFALDQSVINKSVVGYNKGRKELLYAVSRSGDNHQNKSIFVQSTRLQAWYGPWTYPFGINCLCPYTDPNGVQSVLAGCSDGFVRNLDIGTLDDVHSDGTGGIAIPMSVELPVLHFGDAGITKSLQRMKLQAQLPVGSALTLNTTFDDGVAINTAVPAATIGSEQDYRIDLGGQQGKRLKLIFTDSSNFAPTINGFVLSAFDMGRV